MLATRSCRVQSDRHIFPRDQLSLKFVAPQALVRANNSRDSSLLFTSMAAGEERVWPREIIVLINTLTREKYFCARAACTFFRQIIAYRWHNSVYAKLPDPSPSDKGSGSRD